MPSVVETISPANKPVAGPKPVANRLRYFLICTAGVLGVGVVTYSTLAYFKQTKTGTPVTVVNLNTAIPSSAPTSSSTPTPAKAESSLDGTLVDLGKENLHPLAVMIENHPDARPQSGLGEANLVYEAIAEGGITRFMAVYRDPSLAVRVGPIRSARTYFVDLAEELNAFYAHAGGNRDALDQINTDQIYNLDGLSLGNPLFIRDYSRHVAQEHTLYSSTDQLWNYAVSTRKWPQTANFKPWNFTDDAEVSQRPASQQVVVNVSDSLYVITWTYDSKTNLYSRVMAGQPHIDADTGRQITTKNIILETVSRTPVVTSIGEPGWHYNLTGSGSAVVIHNGVATQATWKKTGKERTRYYDSTGKEIALVRGTTWVHIIHPDSKISY